MSSKEPFFMLGCVRSGTTLLRDILRRHPNLASPEETHFYRWAEPFATEAYAKNYQRKALFKQHRQLDKVANFDFFYVLKHAGHRRELLDNYSRIFLEGNGISGRRWFDKTPQNVYGMLLISGQYPDSRFIHIHRHPYNVVASLRAGRSFPEQTTRAAINFWLESMTIIREYRKGFPDRLFELSYEQLSSAPLKTINGLLRFVGEKPFKALPADLQIHGERNLYQDILTTEEIEEIQAACGDLMEDYGYKA